DRFEYRRKRKQAINDTPMTAAEGEKDLALVPLQVNEWEEEAGKPYEECRIQRLNEFWQDCREDLAYDDILLPDGVAALEKVAYEAYYISNKFEDVYEEASKLAGLAEVIARTVKRTKRR